MHFVYIIQNEKGRKYIGSTNDLKRRIADHNRGQTSSTRSAGIWKLVYYEAFLDKGDASREERFLKTGKGREKIEYLIGDALKTK